MDGLGGEASDEERVDVDHDFLAGSVSSRWATGELSRDLVLFEVVSAMRIDVFELDIRSVWKGGVVEIGDMGTRVDVPHRRDDR